MTLFVMLYFTAAGSGKWVLCLGTSYLSSQPRLTHQLTKGLAHLKAEGPCPCGRARTWSSCLCVTVGPCETHFCAFSPYPFL